MIDPKSNKRIYTIDASLLGQSDCLRKVNLLHNEELTTTEASFKMDYGNAFHRFRASFRSNGVIQEARKKALEYFLPKCLGVPLEDFRTVDHLDASCVAYAKRWSTGDVLKPVKINGKPALEFSFSFPYLSTPTYDIVLCGTVDEIGNFDGRDCIVDCKVTALWSKDKFLESFELDPQMRFYSWVLKKYGLTHDYLPAIIDAVFIKKPTEKTWNKSTNKYEKSLEWNGASFQRSTIIEFSEKSMLEFEQWLVWKIKTIIEAEESKNWIPNFNCCEDVYGSCQFKKLCSGYMTKDMFQRRVYDPLAFQA